MTKLDPADIVKHLPSLPVAMTSYELLEEMGVPTTVGNLRAVDRLLAKMTTVIGRTPPAEDTRWSLRR